MKSDDINNSQEHEPEDGSRPQSNDSHSQSADSSHPSGGSQHDSSRMVEATGLYPLPVEGLRQVLEQLMLERFGSKPLFIRYCHWMAVYRVMVDYHWCYEADYELFGDIVARISPAKVNKAYKRSSLKMISQTIFHKPFSQWKYEKVLCRSRRSYQRMYTLTYRLFELVDSAGLRPPGVASPIDTMDNS